MFLTFKILTCVFVSQVFLSATASPVQEFKVIDDKDLDNFSLYIEHIKEFILKFLRELIDGYKKQALEYYVGMKESGMKYYMDMVDYSEDMMKKANDIMGDWSPTKINIIDLIDKLQSDWSPTKININDLIDKLQNEWNPTKINIIDKLQNEWNPMNMDIAGLTDKAASIADIAAIIEYIKNYIKEHYNGWTDNTAWIQDMDFSELKMKDLADKVGKYLTKMSVWY